MLTTLPRRLARNSIRVRLMWMVGLGIVIATALQVFMSYRVALAEVAAIADYHMIEMAHALRRSMPESGTRVVPVQLGAHVPADEGNCFTLRVRYVDASSSSAENGQRVRRHFSTRTEGGQALRVLYVEAPGMQIEVTHDLSFRAQSARQLALRSITPGLVILPLLLIGVWFSTARALRPLRRTRNEIARREAGDLKPLSIEYVPEEAQAFVAEINTLFTRINAEFEARRNFTADVAHELRSPLAALSLQVQGLMRAQTPAARTVAHERVMAGITRATRLVEQLLVLAREDAAPAAMGVASLPQAARLALSDVLTQAQARGIDLGAELLDTLPESALIVTADPEALRTLLRNLLDNAIKYSPPGGVVNLALRSEADGLHACVEDSGPGIAPEARARLFERFQRGRSGHDTGGSGLGLAIVRTIAERQGIALRLDISASLGGLAVHLRFARAPLPPA